MIPNVIPLRRAQDQYFASKIGLENCNSKIVIVFRIPLYCSITSFCEWLRMLGWRGFTYLRNKIAKFNKLRSSLCVLYRRMRENWKQKQFSGRLDFDDQESSLITRLLGLLKHYLQKTITIFNYNFQADFSMQKNSPAPGVTPVAGSNLLTKFSLISQFFPLHIQITLRTQRYLK